MSLFDRIVTGFSAAALSPVPLPKSGKGAASEPGHRTIVGGTEARLRETDRGLLTSDRLNVRNSRNTQEAIRTLSYSSPDMSAAVYAALRTGIPEKFTVLARDMDGKINPAATGLAHELLRRITFLGNPDGTYNAQLSIQSLSESLGRQLITYGAMAGEVALDKARVPSSLNPISVPSIKWYDEDKTVRPVQLVGGEEIELDIPTFIYVSLDQDLQDAYASSPLESAIQPILADIDFNNDIRRALKRAVLPRLMATIDSEMVKKFTPPDVLNDAKKFADYKTALIGAVQDVVNGAAPEDALISFSEIEYSILDGGTDPSTIIEKLQKVLNGKLQTGVKTMPVVLGHGASSNASSTESLLFLKSANAIRVKLNEFYSKALTMAVRLLGEDVYVEFVYAKLDLRPDSELEAYKQMEQSRLLDQLSIGFISDEEACVALTGNLPPAGYKPLMGTMFRSMGASAAAGGASKGDAQPGTPASGTSGMKKTPEAPKGGGKAEVDNVEVMGDALNKAHKEALSAVSDMAYSMTRSAHKPVEVNVAPTELHLTLAEAPAPKTTKSIRIQKDAQGRMTSMDLVEVPVEEASK